MLVLLAVTFVTLTVFTSRVTTGDTSLAVSGPTGTAHAPGYAPVAIARSDTAHRRR